ncbi:MAG: hypothetical protein WCF92_02035 [bacterium]
MKPIEDFSDEELLAVIRQAENANISGSLYQRANNEWQIRHQQRILEATKNGHGGISFEVEGNMINDGVIKTDSGAKVDIAVLGNYSSKKGKIIQGEDTLKNKSAWYLNWWMKYIFYPLFVSLLAGFVIALWVEKNSHPEERSASIITENQSGGNNTVINNPALTLVREDFQSSSLGNNFEANGTLDIQLKDNPIPNSVNVWWGAMLLNPGDYKTFGKTVKIDFDQNQASSIKSAASGTASDLLFVVTYNKNLN